MGWDGAMRIAGIVMAGGLARRLGGGDKGLRLVGGRTLLDRVVERARPQVGDLALNANGDAARFAALGLPVVPDDVPGNPGPLAGILAGLDWAAASFPDAAWVASFAADTPFFPPDLVARLADARSDANAEAACAASGGRLHPVFGLWPVAARSELRRALVESGLRKVEAWARRGRLAIAEFSTTPFDPFVNVNTPADLAEVERLAAAHDVRARTAVAFEPPEPP
jgi:molybdopterin-guanine dinucleotide biosynthesis protein A